MGSIEISLLSHLPCPAVECIQRHVWSHQGIQGPDVRRHVLLLVCKQWKRCFELAPDAWNEVSITDDDLWPISKPIANFKAVKSWFAKHGKFIRKLRVDLAKWETKHCNLQTLETMLAGALRAVHGNVTHLVLRVQGAPLTSAHVWLQLASEVSSPQLDNNKAKLWPNLRVLELEIDGKGAPSQSQASHAAKQVLSTLPCLKSLREVSISLTSTKLRVLPPVLGICDQIEELIIDFAANGEPGGLVLPAKRPSLPLPKNLKKLCLINPPFAFEDVIGAVNRSHTTLEIFSVTSN
ncbi:hypothetical protein Ndes2526A_g06564 [Nannochloris sp. 'desiccata']